MTNQVSSWASEYLSWRNAYLPAADIRPDGLVAEPLGPTPDNRVDQQEWEYFLHGQALSQKQLHDDYTIKIELLRGDRIGDNLRPAAEFFADYADFAAFINHYRARNPGVVPGPALSNDPEALLALAQKHPDSIELVGWLGEATRFQNVSDDFRQAAADYLIDKLSATADCKLTNALAEALLELLASPRLPADSLRVLADVLLGRLTSADFYEAPRLTQLFFSLLEKDQFSEEERAKYFSALLALDRAFGVPAAAVSILMQSSTLSEAEIINLCRLSCQSIESFKDVYKGRDLIVALAYAYLNPRLSNASAQEVLEMLKDVARKVAAFSNGSIGGFYYLSKSIMLSLSLMMTANFRPLADPAARQQAIFDFTDILIAKPENISFDVPRDLFANLAEFLPTGEFTSLFAAYVDRYLARPYPDLKYLAQALGVLINRIHDRDLEQNDNLRALLNWQRKHQQISAQQYQVRLAELNAARDAHRRQISAKLSLQSKIMLISLAGPDLYTTTFEALYASLPLSNDKIDELLAALNSANSRFPDQDITINFMLTAASFNRLSSLIAVKPAFFLGELKTILGETDQEKLISKVFLLSSVINELLSSPQYARLKSQVESILLQFYRTQPSPPLAYLIKDNQANFSIANQAEVANICQGLPEILAPVVPAQWLNNNQIKIKLFFYQKEHYGLIQSMYRGYGFAIKSIDADTVLMTKVINGVKIMVEATTNTDIDIINKTIDDESYAMVGHRGHSYQLPETFSPFEDHRNKQKLLYIGSCGGFRSIPQLMHYYFGNYFIATESVGVGAVNNEVAYHLVAALALNKTKVLANQYHFQDILSYILKKMPNFEKTGLVMPHHKALLLYDFLEKIKNTNGQTAAD